MVFESLVKDSGTLQIPRPSVKQLWILGVFLNCERAMTVCMVEVAAALIYETEFYLGSRTISIMIGVTFLSMAPVVLLAKPFLGRGDTRELGIMVFCMGLAFVATLCFFSFASGAVAGSKGLVTRRAPRLAGDHAGRCLDLWSRAHGDRYFGRPRFEVRRE